MTDGSQRLSFDTDDRSISTSYSNLSKNSELYLNRIHQETNRLRKKRKERRDSADPSIGSVSEDLEVDDNVVEAESSDSTAAEAVALRLKQKQQLSLIHTDTTVKNSDSNLSSVAATNKIDQKQTASWKGLIDSSERSIQSCESEEEGHLTLRSCGSSRSSHSVIFSQIPEADDDSDTNESDVQGVQSSESRLSSEALGCQRGDSIAENNQLEDPVKAKANSSSNSYFSGLYSKKKRGMSGQMSNENDEAFKKKLIDEVLGKDAGDKVSMEKIVMIIWQFRDDEDVITFMTRFVSKFAGSRDVFDGIEFYLPQLAHMLIHLEVDWDDAILEQFCLVIAQQSIHFALQLNWILAGAIEDYQPELPDGTPNPKYNPLFYIRCVKLLTNIERCVVYFRPQSQELQRLYEKGKITLAEMHSLEQADRRFTAMQITAPHEEDAVFGGTLKYKRAVRTSYFKFKRWKVRYFAIEERMLNCYNHEGGKLIRSMPLEGATVQAMTQTKYPNTLSVSNRSFEFRMRACSEENRNKWIKMLEIESKTGRVFGHTDEKLRFENNMDAQRVIDELTPSQRERYLFYRNEREFVRSLTDVAEELRFSEASERKKLAPGLVKNLEILPHAYSPLLSSTDIFRRIHSTLSKETRVFNTKARCPTVMYFLGVRGELESKGERHSNMDIAEYIHLKFDAKEDENVGWKDAEMKTTTNENGEEVIEVELRTDEHLSADAKEYLVVKKTAVPTIAEGDETATPSKSPTERTDEMYTPNPRARENDANQSQSFVWSGSFTDTPAKERKPQSGQTVGSPSRANRHLRKFLRESMVKVPNKLAHHLEKKGTRHASTVRSKSGTSVASSSNSLAANTEPVPIATSSNHDGKAEDVWIGRSSIMDKSKIIKGTVRMGDIDEASMNRAKHVVSGGESWAEKSFRMLEGIKNKPKDEMVQLEIVSMLVKSNDDLRQEVFIMQMIHYYKSVFIAAGLPLRLKTYKILSTSASTGFLEFMVDATSIDGLKKSEHYPTEGGLRRYFEETYGGPDSKSFRAAQRNFVQSLAAYSVVCHLLGLKDRHNGNIMIDTRGYLIHIDFGFCLGMNVAHEFTFERAPFKLTEEYVEVMGGTNGEAYKEFQRLFVEGMIEARSKCRIALGLVEIMMHKSNYPCFSGRRYGGNQAYLGFRKRLMLDVPDGRVESEARALIHSARNHLGTRLYDSFQNWTNGYAI
mmetsp:Transcript_6258/g.15485  ORF Transcript_6258/g.15485 Transcript_6258/m.15485 type:complete len:1206 (-) Transcript_6258:200-3817(-)|eukprot:CAMPEP_0197187110 /NCGR_PEP_ID=MMETSP1423-20130617/15264_1 /TAXON_ID=476441 /ORGANISM="Pseudo-nitzschia heimii, Strain UNC1101" /LENGTH=1205 /DNA_ID=CAMNT_0042638603 /DNA_START=214 /DNA_END=3831 /DNA_ORIENTATION=-